jgi:hypothetical protein
MVPPINTPEAITANAPHQLERMPISTRLKMSRPTSSVPNQWEALGPVKGIPIGRLGLKGAIRLAKMVTITTAATAANATEEPTDVPTKALCVRARSRRKAGGAM